LFVSETLKNHFETSATIQTKSLILAEWNMNMPDNIFYVGNYRYRPIGSEIKYRTLPVSFDQLDEGDYYTDATDSEISIDGGVDNQDLPQQFTSIEEKRKLLYSLEDCLKPFRPRSGINKPLFFYNNNQYLANSGEFLAQRPRYYMSSRYDQFKYWNSYRKEDGLERGIAKISGGQYYIDDAVPFVVYKEQVPANRIIIKMQTNVGDVDLTNFVNFSSNTPDPLYGDSNKTTPKRWKIQYLKNNNWTDAYSFNENSTRLDGSAIIKSDGYVELEYGLIVPDRFIENFLFIDTHSSTTLLPESSINGYAYLIKHNESDLGVFYVWNSTLSEYETFIPQYGWTLGSELITSQTNFVKNFVSPKAFLDPITKESKYTEFEYIRGIRVVVELMNKNESTFDLIEMSPRLVADISDSVIEYTVRKSLSDLGNTSLPVGQLLASTGSISIFDIDQAFNYNNLNSIIKNYLRKNIKFNFYEEILNVEGSNYFVPIKTLYSEGMPQSDVTAGKLSLELRDFYFFLESMPAPRILVTEVSLSYAISLLLDYIGFTNYSFKRVDNENDPIIPYFFVAPDQNVAEVLNQLAISTQTAMFFDEYNNFIVMSKDYLMPTNDMRNTDIDLLGNNNQSISGIIENQTLSKIPNIIAISSEDKKIFNDGKINYTTRYIQRSYGSIRQSSVIDKEKTWIYKPVLLWEASGTTSTKTINEVASKQSKYVLGAMPLNSDLSNSLPTVVNGIVTNNIIDIGENVYWLTRYQGYLFSNGEIIRYDAAEFSITGIGNVWISSNQEYQKYFASLPFNGKIYPTGLIRIFSTPYYETNNSITRLQPGEVYEHGRGQFGTPVTSHTAGIDSYWSNNDYVRGCNMKSQYLFTTDVNPTLPQTSIGPAGINNVLSKQTSRNSIIKNYMATSYSTETEVNNLKSTQSGTIQSSALVMNGPSFKSTETPIDFVSYVYKNLDNAYKNFGTRMRIIGKIENNEIRSQTPIGSMPYYQIGGVQANQSISIGGGSGGLAVMLNPETNNGYYFEIVALTENNVESYLNLDKNNQSNISINNIIFYKIKKENSSDNAIPIKLWGGLSQILVDDGKFTGQHRVSGEENPTVYDLSVEYQDIGNIRRFFLYINNQIVKVVDDPDPLPVYNNIALFTRGSSKCMFENVYALSENYSQNSSVLTGDTILSTFKDKEVSSNESFRKYEMNKTVQSTYLSGISAQQPPKYNMYFEEFGSIMRECAYFNIKYDRAYPALYAELSPTFNRIKTYTVSGFYADSYGAEFLIFNSTDSAINLDETTGNYLRIQGIAFTQDTTHELSVDEYFKKRGNLSDPPLQGNSLTYSPIFEKVKYDQIKLSRLIYGKNEFSINTPYIQTQDDAEALMGWIINKVMTPKKSIGLKLFAIPTLQLGDIVTIDYKNSDNLNLISSENDRFVVYNIEYSRNINGPDMTVYLSEV
jgi:hypothetical protein